MASYLRMDEVDLAGLRLLIRVDFNVPMAGGQVGDDSRLRAALPTIEMARTSGAGVLLMSHLGRPVEGSADPAASLQPVADRLAELLGRPVPLISDWLDYDIQPGTLALAENVRFNAGEKDNDQQLARRMAQRCDLFVMDAFGTAHRAHASTHGVAKFAPVACAGPLLVASWNIFPGRWKTRCGHWWQLLVDRRYRPNWKCCAR